MGKMAKKVELKTVSDFFSLHIEYWDVFFIMKVSVLIRFENMPYMSIECQ